MRSQPVVHVLGALIVLAYVFQTLASPATQEALFAAFAVIPARLQPGPLAFHSPMEALGPFFGHVFLHGGLLHLGMNLLVYFQVANGLADRLGERGGAAWRFLAFFFGSAAAGAGAYVLFDPGSEIPAVGASGAICGLFAGYLLGARRDWRAALADRQIRRAAFWFLFINVGLAALARMTNLLPIAWEAHLGGFVGGFVLFPLLAPRRPSYAGPWG
jgi:membrane associated rhomboid family serine protease